MAVAVTRRLGDNEKFDNFAGFVENLMRHAGRNFRAFVGFENFYLTIDFERYYALQDEKKLSRLFVIMPNFRSSGRHPFVNDAEV